MIGTFWNMCRACPSIPADKLSSEYTSNYRWHEYTGPRHEVIRRPPQGLLSSGSRQEPDLPRRKKHPEIAYKAHEFLSDSGSEAFLGDSLSRYRVRSEERWASSREKNSRRSKSEGPQARKPANRSILMRPKNVSNRSSALAKNKESFFNDENKAPTDSTCFIDRSCARQSESIKTIPPKKEEINPLKESILNFSNARVDEISPKKFEIKGANPREVVPIHKMTTESKNNADREGSQPAKTYADPENNNAENSPFKHDDVDGELKSEYKKNFQPFNRYDFDESKGIFEKRPNPMTSYNSTDPPGDPPPSLSWYKEVVLLRQKANQYRHRGWGTELVPDHIARLYNDQMMVWEQVSRRSTLSALSLATSVRSRNQSPSKEEKENKKSSPVKSLSRARSAKASRNMTGTHQGKSEKKKAPASKAQVELSPKKGRNQVKKLDVKGISPIMTSQKSGVGPTPTMSKPLNPSSEKSKRRPRPTSLITTVPSGSKTNQLKKMEKKGGQADDVPATDQEQIVKSPPEPTRVKSPEQIVIRSPEPVNWTVPLDTGKTFTVTQNIREGDLAPRSLSEVRAWTPGSGPPPPASISAPTELIELTKANLRGEILTK